MAHIVGGSTGVARCERCNAEVLERGVCAACMLRDGLSAPPGEEHGDRPCLEIREDSETAISRLSQNGSVVEGYELLSELGRGGMGVVYLAEQTRPVRRRVALKLIKPGMDTRQVIARFEAERQALALMDHPGVAKVLGAGTSQAGRPYFVMELVRGPRVTDYCDHYQLCTRERLEIFQHICRAIQHAHQKGIIHRDIKPSNILVTQHDGAPIPKVIDFGIAKATGDFLLTEQTLITGCQQFLGTPAYTSPEQAEASCDIDTRTDIYSLGVLLYELLTGKTPFDSHDLKSSGWEGMRRTIRETQPPRPSTRLSTLAMNELQSIARRRRAEPPRLIHAIRGDLDWIVMRCLEKDPGRRYENCSSLLHDIQRHLENQPIAARPPSTLYKVQKMVRRNKLPLVVGAVVMGALLSALAVICWSLAKGRKAQDTINFFKSTQIERTVLPPNTPIPVSPEELPPKLQRGTALGAIDELTTDPAPITQAPTLRRAIGSLHLAPELLLGADASSGENSNATMQVSLVGRQLTEESSAGSQTVSADSAQMETNSSPVLAPSGATYTQWAAAWWQWFMELPLTNAGAVHPNFDSPFFNVAMGQSPGVWFLATPFGYVHRSCIIPRDTWLCVGMLNVESSSLESGNDNPFFGATAQVQARKAKFFCDHIKGLFCEIDGVPVSDIYSYRAPSPQITFTAPTPWTFGEVGGTGTSTGDGYFLLLRPLPPGQHVLHYGGSFQFHAPPDPFSLEAGMEMTYVLTVP